jgi:hypothetical protein
MPLGFAVVATASAMAASICAVFTSPGAPCGIPKLKCTFVPSKLTSTVALLPGGSVDAGAAPKHHDGI